MKKAKRVLISGIVILLIIGVYIFSSYSPTIAIRKHLFLLDPFQAFTCDILPTALPDFELRRVYIVKGFINNSSGEPIQIAYVKNNSLGLYYWAGGGLWRNRSSFRH